MLRGTGPHVWKDQKKKRHRRTCEALAPLVSRQLLGRSSSTAVSESGSSGPHGRAALSRKGELLGTHTKVEATLLLGMPFSGRREWTERDDRCVNQKPVRSQISESAGRGMDGSVSAVVPPQCRKRVVRGSASGSAAQDDQAQSERVKSREANDDGRWCQHLEALSRCGGCLSREDARVAFKACRMVAAPPVCYLRITRGSAVSATDDKSAETVYVLHLRARSGADGIRSLRAALKVLGRRFGLKAVSVREEAVERRKRAA